MNPAQTLKRIARRRREQQEWIRLKQTPRYTPTTATLHGRPVSVPDACTYLVGMKEIFQKGIYEFCASTTNPLILDCGANIGLSVIYFKLLYPNARVIAFEPDPAIFQALVKNVASFDLRNVELHQAAVWTENGSVAFMQEGGFSGRVQAGSLQTVSVPSLRLRDQLANPVDFLKVDIEGAEFDVILDCADRLSNVNRLFIEYHSEANKPQRLDELLAVIRQAGFRYQIQEAHVARKPFLTRRVMMGMDLQLNLFCFRDTPA